MHKESRQEMRLALARHVDSELSAGGKVVVDLGSYDVCGTYRCLIPENNKYIGIDAQEGPNVDLVMTTEFVMPLEPESVDILLCGQTLEHCTNPFKLVEDMYRVVNPGGWVFLAAPFIWRPHFYPLDCFRFLPQGMESVLVSAGFTHIESYLKPVVNMNCAFQDCWGIGKK